MSSEESRQSPPLCADGCGFFGSPATLNLCSKCYRDYCRIHDKLPKIVAPKAYGSTEKEEASDFGESSTLAGSALIGLASDEGLNCAVKDRCRRCNRKMGLLRGFKCRCGRVYCPAHRYPEEHACTFDFKAAAKDAIAMANPVIKADKLDRRV